MKRFSAIAVLLLFAAPAWGEHLATLINDGTTRSEDVPLLFPGTTRLQAYAGTAGLDALRVSPADVGTTWTIPAEYPGYSSNPSNSFIGLYLGNDFGYENFRMEYLLAGGYLYFIHFDWLVPGGPEDYIFTHALVTLESLDIWPHAGGHNATQWVHGSLRMELFGDFIPPTPGDFNKSGVVDAADYVLWRNKFTSPLGAEGDLPNESGQTPGYISQEDYQFWRSQFGHSGLPQGAALGAAVIPEPATWAMVALAMAAFTFTRKRG